MRQAENGVVPLLQPTGTACALDLAEPKTGKGVRRCRQAGKCACGCATPSQSADDVPSFTFNERVSQAEPPAHNNFAFSAPAQSVFPKTSGIYLHCIIHPPIHSQFRYVGSFVCAEASQIRPERGGRGTFRSG